MSALLVDAGNSRIKWCLWSDACAGDAGVLDTAAYRAGDAALPESGYSTVLASNVAGERVAERLRKGPGARGDLTFVQTVARHGEVVNAYEEPQRLGVDRWVALLGARAESQAACLVVDAGTAVTLDALASDGRHLGGQILPGAPLMMASLATGTSDLPDIAAEPGNAPLPEHLFATQTDDAIRRGAWTAVVGAIEHAFRRLEESEGSARLVLTGGDAPRMLDAIAVTVDHRPDLVLHGLAFILESAA